MSLLILVGGGSASGKTTFAEMVARQLVGLNVALLSMDRYYKDLGHLAPVETSAFNFDHPEAIDLRRLVRDVRALLSGEPVCLPDYDFISHTSGTEPDPTPSSEVVIVEGIFALYSEELLHMASLRLFIDTDADLRLARRLARDVSERGLDTRRVLSQYLATVRPMHRLFVEPTKCQADIVIPGDRDLAIAKKLVDGFALTELVNAAIESRSFSELEAPLPASACPARLATSQKKGSASDLS